MEGQQKFDDVHYFDVEMPSVWEVWDSCMHPSIVQIAQFLSTYIIWNIAFRITSQTGNCKTDMSVTHFTETKQNVHIFFFL